MRGWQTLNFVRPMLAQASAEAFCDSRYIMLNTDHVAHRRKRSLPQMLAYLSKAVEVDAGNSRDVYSCRPLAY